MQKRDAQQIKIGLICVSLEGEHTELADEFLKRAKKAFKTAGIEIANPDSAFTTSSEEVRRETFISLQNDCQGIIYMAGTWLLASHVIDAISEISVPVGIWGLPEPVSFSSVGANVLHGTLMEIGRNHVLFNGYPEDEDTISKICSFAKAACVKRKLAHLKIGLIGGKTISAYPTDSDHNQIKRVFGAETEHIDQLVLLEKARKADKKEIENKILYIKNKYGKVSADETALERAVSVYFALKELIEDYRLDCCSVKCIGEFMDSYSSACLALTLLNDEGYVCGCQCNLNALISADVLTLLSGEPAFFGDVNTVDFRTGIARIINCGSVPGKLASDYNAISLVNQYEYMGQGGGVCTLFCCKAGKVTFGTFGRIKGKYVMHIAEGEAVEKPVKDLISVRTWAQGFIKLKGDPEIFYENLLCNHSVLGYGIHSRELKMLCKLLEVQVL